MKKNSGVTLLELLVGLVVAGILMSLAVPSFRAMLVRRRVEVVGDALIADFRFARSEALKRGHSVTICRSSGGVACEAAGGWEAGWIVFDDKSGDAAIDSDEAVLRTQQALPEGLSVSATGGSATTGPRYEFRANGLATGAGGRITVTADPSLPGGSRLLCVSMQGRLTVQAAGATSC